MIYKELLPWGKTLSLETVATRGQIAEDHDPERSGPERAETDAVGAERHWLLWEAVGNLCSVLVADALPRGIDLPGYPLLCHLNQSRFYFKLCSHRKGGGLMDKSSSSGSRCSNLGEVAET